MTITKRLWQWARGHSLGPANPVPDEYMRGFEDAKRQAMDLIKKTYTMDAAQAKILRALWLRAAQIQPRNTQGGEKQREVRGGMSDREAITGHVDAFMREWDRVRVSPRMNDIWRQLVEKAKARGAPDDIEKHVMARIAQRIERRTIRVTL